MTARSVPADVAYSLLESSDPPSGLTVNGVLDYSEKCERKLPRTFPDSLSVDVLDLSGRDVTTLPRGLTCYELNLSRTPMESLPDVPVHQYLVNASTDARILEGSASGIHGDAVRGFGVRRPPVAAVV